MELIILHGAIGAAAQLSPLATYFSNKYTVHTLNFSGHGGLPEPAAPYSISLFAQDVLTYMDLNGLSKASVFGYSMGGYVGMYLAKHYPEKIDRIITLATKFHWDEAIAAKEGQMLNPEKIEQKLPAFAETLNLRHAPTDWKKLLQLTGEMMLAMGTENPLQTGDYSTISHPSLIMLGDRDKMVTLEETVAVYKSLPNAQLCILPGTAHPIEGVDVMLLGSFVERFLKG